MELLDSRTVRCSRKIIERGQRLKQWNPPYQRWKTVQRDQNGKSQDWNDQKGLKWTAW